MDAFAWLMIGLGIVLALLVAVMIWVKRDGGDGLELPDLRRMRAALEIAVELVAAAEQLWLSGQMENAEDRYGWVHRQLEELFPDLEPDMIKATIESAVYWIRQGVKRLTVVEGEQ